MGMFEAELQRVLNRLESIEYQLTRIADTLDEIYNFKGVKHE